MYKELWRKGLGQLTMFNWLFISTLYVNKRWCKIPGKGRSQPYTWQRFICGQPHSCKEKAWYAGRRNCFQKGRKSKSQKTKGHFHGGIMERPVAWCIPQQCAPLYQSLLQAQYFYAHHWLPCWVLHIESNKTPRRIYLRLWRNPPWWCKEMQLRCGRL